MAKAKTVVGDLGSAEVQALVRSYNSLLIVLQNIVAEKIATHMTVDQAFVALNHVLSTGVDNATSGVGTYVPTGRMVYGVKSSPVHPGRSAETPATLVDMGKADKF